MEAEVGVLRWERAVPASTVAMELQQVLAEKSRQGATGTRNIRAQGRCGGNPKGAVQGETPA